MRQTSGDLIDFSARGLFDVMVHGCNCFCAMGKGLALQVKEAFPEAYEADREGLLSGVFHVPDEGWRTHRLPGNGLKGSRDRLGRCTAAKVRIPQERVLTIVNAYSQFSYRGPEGQTDYRALEHCLRWVALTYSGKRIGLPRIGAGLGGGDWLIIESLIEDIFRDEDVCIVNYEPAHRVLVCGGRDYDDEKAMFRFLDALRPRPNLVIEGEQRGADLLARKWAELRGILVDPHRADWDRYKRAAGPIRNGAMLRYGEPHLVVAFPGGTGTANMVKQAYDAGVPVLMGP